MNIVNMKEIELRAGDIFNEYTISLDNRLIYCNIPKDSVDSQDSYEESEMWLYTCSIEDVDLNNEQDYYFEASDEVRKEIFNLCVNYKEV